MFFMYSSNVEIMLCNCMSRNKTINSRFKYTFIHSYTCLFNSILHIFKLINFVFLHMYKITVPVGICFLFYFFSYILALSCSAHQTWISKHWSIQWHCVYCIAQEGSCKSIKQSSHFSSERIEITPGCI